MYLVTRILKWIDMKMNEHCYNKIIKAMFWVFLSVGFSTWWCTTIQNERQTKTRIVSIWQLTNGVSTPFNGLQKWKTASKIKFGLPGVLWAWGVLWHHPSSHYKAVPSPQGDPSCLQSILLSSFLSTEQLSFWVQLPSLWWRQPKMSVRFLLLRCDYCQLGVSREAPVSCYSLTNQRSGETLPDVSESTSGICSWGTIDFLYMTREISKYFLWNW